MLYPTIEKTETDDYTLFNLKPTPRIVKPGEAKILIEDLDEWAQKAFDGCEKLNTI